MRDRDLDAEKLSFIFLWRQPDWGLYNRRNEAFARELASRGVVERVLHIEPLPLGALAGIIRRWMQADSKALRSAYWLHIRKALCIRPIMIEPKLYVYTLFTVPGRGKFLLNTINRLITQLQLALMLLTFSLGGKSKKVIIAYPPSFYIAHAVRVIEHGVLLADLVDDVIARTRDMQRKREYEEHYRDILPLCDWVFTTSPQLAVKYASYANQHIEFLPNGVTTKKGDPGCNITPETTIGRQKVGYVGYHNETMDIDLVDHIVANNPEVDFIFIGPVSKSIAPAISRLNRSYKNVHFLGEKIHEEALRYLEGCDVLISFKKADFRTQGNDSIKIYEYLATGKPIVSTPVAPAHQFSSLIYVADNKHQFDEYLKQALKEDNPILRTRRKQKAEENSVEKRIEIILARVFSFL